MLLTNGTGIYKKMAKQMQDNASSLVQHRFEGSGSCGWVALSSSRRHPRDRGWVLFVPGMVFFLPVGSFFLDCFFCPPGVFLFRSVFLVPRIFLFVPGIGLSATGIVGFLVPLDIFGARKMFFLCPTEMKCPRVFLVPVSFGNIDFEAWFNEKSFRKQRYGRC